MILSSHRFLLSNFCWHISFLLVRGFLFAGKTFNLNTMKWLSFDINFFSLSSILLTKVSCFLFKALWDYRHKTLCLYVSCVKVTSCSSACKSFFLGLYSRSLNFIAFVSIWVCVFCVENSAKAMDRKWGK